MVLIFGLTVVLFGVLASQLALHGLTAVALILVGASGSTAAVGWLGLRAAGAVENTWRRFAVDGTSTPYKEQFSYQQALVMQGRLDDALESFEAVITEQPASVDARLRAAELYARARGNHARAAELFRQVQRIESVSTGEFILATNRLVDLYNGPLGEPGRAMVELRRLIERHPNSRAAAHAREVLARMKSTSNPSSPAAS
jgi:tetratricopeptide (TPR) repeat protein